MSESPLFEYSRKTSIDAHLLETVKPAWVKVAESEMRLGFMDKMYRKKLSIKELENYAKAQNAELRTEEM